ncbi:hypothetical protein F511_44858 [Dorcoceras hygrometricum]|uniref:Uncharacterized protein n=1 Tax=Dorcoceras hygrometricum TaxID=472368 RepID=A0A2Z7B3J8_9LAMI|nr:hypothetical protein F511_44858 [Dorcoceras hygrometricum]
MKRRRLERSGSACNISRCLSVNLYRVGYDSVLISWSDAVLVVAPGTSCEELLRLVVQLRADFNDGQLYCSLRLVSCSLRLVVLHES